MLVTPFSILPPPSSTTPFLHRFSTVPLSPLSTLRVFSFFFFFFFFLFPFRHGAPFPPFRHRDVPIPPFTPFFDEYSPLPLLPYRKIGQLRRLSQTKNRIDYERDEDRYIRFGRGSFETYFTRRNKEKRKEGCLKLGV